MIALMSSALPVVGLGLFNDVGGYVTGPEFGAILASLLSAIFGGFFSVFVGGLFGNQA